MLIPMSSWLESVITALAPCDFTTWMAPARAMSGAFPEFASTSANRRSGRPACFIAWFAVPTARRIESAQLGVAMDPLRSITWPMFTVTVFAPSGLQAAHRTSAAATRDILVIPSPLRVESRPPSDCPARWRRGQKNVDGEGPFFRASCRRPRPVFPERRWGPPSAQRRRARGSRARWPGPRGCATASPDRAKASTHRRVHRTPWHPPLYSPRGLLHEGAGGSSSSAAGKIGASLTRGVRRSHEAPPSPARGKMGAGGAGTNADAHEEAAPGGGRGAAAPLRRLPLRSAAGRGRAHLTGRRRFRQPRPLAAALSRAGEGGRRHRAPDRHARSED